MKRDLLPLLASMYAYALRMTMNEADAEDIVQDACVRALKYEREDIENFKSWVFRIVHNCFMDYLKQRKKHIYVDDFEAFNLPETQEAMQSPRLEAQLFRNALSEDVEAALKELPVPIREAVVLTDIECLSIRDAAAVLEVPEGTIKSRLWRGRKFLFNKLYLYASQKGFVGGANEEL